MDCKKNGNDNFMAVCNYGGEGHIILISHDSTLNYIFSEIVERWKHLSPAMIDVKFYIPNNSRMPVKLMMDKDVTNMYDIHRKLKAAIIEMVVSHSVLPTESPTVVIKMM